MIPNELMLLILTPLIIAFINLFIPVILRKIMTLLLILFTSAVVIRLYLIDAAPLYILDMPVFSIDKLGLLTVTFIQVLSLIILVFSLKGVEKNAEKNFFVLYPLTVSFCNGAVLSENAISFMIFWGLSGLALYLFGTLGQTPGAPKTAKKTFIIIGGSDVFLIMGLVLVAYVSPFTGWSLKNPQILLDGGWDYAAFIMLLIAAFAKAGGFPFHTWVPDFCRDSQVESAALFPASLDKLIGIYLLARMVTAIFLIQPFMHMIIITLGAITVITAVMMAMTQHNGRRLLGYHAVSQVGYMIMGVGSGSVLAFAGGLFHMINNVIYKSNLFLTLGSVEKKTGTNDLDNLGGLGKLMPFTFIAALIGALSISGIPPFNGFFSKWMIYQGLIEKTATLSSGYQIWMLGCITIAIFGSALTLASFMKFIHAIYLGRKSANLKNITEAPFNQVVSTGLLALMCIGFGISAVALPLNYFIYPVLAESGLQIPAFQGFYDPMLLTAMVVLSFFIGYIVYFFIKKVRYDDIYIGGMEPREEFRLSGTEFYHEIRNFSWVKKIYDLAEKDLFDIYETGKEFTFKFSRAFQLAHPGQMQFYTLYITLGLLIILIVLL
jgi:formate hydrogenlyase subunit 3/multisubunit Na+/H+ antiporter MnhD subunit